MIEGRFGTKGQIYFDIDLVGDDGLILPTEVVRFAVAKTIYLSS